MLIRTFRALALAGLTLASFIPNFAEARFCDGADMASCRPFQGMVRAPETHDAFALFLSGDRSCGSAGGGACFAERFAAALTSAAGLASVTDVLQAAGRGSPQANLSISLGSKAQIAPPAFRTPEAKRIALLVGVSDYGDLRSADALQNVARMEQALRSAGFEIRVLLDPDLPRLEAARAALRADLASPPLQGALSLVYLDGLGFALNGENMFCLRTARGSADLSVQEIGENCRRIADFISQDLAPSVLIVNGLERQPSLAR